MKNFYSISNIEFEHLKKKYSLYLTFVLVLLLGTISLSCVGSSAPIGLPSGVIVEDNLYIGTMDQDIRSLNTETGELVWIHEFDNEEDKNIAFYGNPVINHKAGSSARSLYFTSYNGKLYIVRLEDNAGQLSPTLSDNIVIGESAPIVGGTTLVEDNLLVPSSDGKLHAYNIEQLAKLWEFPTSNKIWATPVFKDSIVYFGSLDHNLYAINAKDGSLFWDKPFKTKGAIVSKPLIVDQTVYIGSFDGVFYGIDIETGLEKARFTGGEGWYWGGAISDGGTIFVGSLDGNIYALNKSNLSIKWKFDAEESIVGSPIIIYQDSPLHNKLVFSSTDGKLRTVNLSDGQNMRQCKLDIKLKSNLVSNGNMVFISGDDHSIRGILINQNGNLNEEWVHYTDKDDPIPRDFDRSC